MTAKKRRVLSLILAALLLCLTAAPASAVSMAPATAATMRLMKSTGTVNVSSGSGRGLTKRDNMRLYNGYRVETKAKSYAWINLDSARLAKLDALSNVEVRKSGKVQELLLKSGNLYFNVSKPLGSDETLNIRTSTMVMGIRGTAGMVRMLDRWSAEIYVLEGTVQCSATDPVTGQTKTETIQSGEKAVATAYPQDRTGDKCDVIRQRFEVEEIDGFVLKELAQDPGLCADIFEKSGLDILARIGPLESERRRSDSEDGKLLEELAQAREKGEEIAQERLEQDQQEMREELKRIEEELDKQEHNVSTDPVWEQEQGTADGAGSDGNSGGAAAGPSDPGAPAAGGQGTDDPNGPADSGGELEEPAPKNIYWEFYVTMLFLTTRETENMLGSLEDENWDIWGQPIDVESIKSIVIDGGVTLIRNQAFHDLPYLAQLYIEDGVTGIGDYAFIGCFRLTEVQISGSVADIGTSAFYGCSNLTEVRILGSVANIGTTAFANCGIQNLVIPDGAESIGESAFASNRFLRNVEIPASVTSIGQDVFDDCPALTDIYYGGSQAEWLALVGPDGYGDTGLDSNTVIHFNGGGTWP